MHRPKIRSTSEACDDNSDSGQDPHSPERVRTREDLTHAQALHQDAGKEERLQEEETLAAEFLAHHRDAGKYLRANVEHLVRIATCGDESQEDRAAGAIFGSLVEGLCDAFDPDSVALYIRLMAQIIQYCRKLDDRLDRELNGFGLATEEDLIARGERLRPGPASPVSLSAPDARLLDPDRLKQKFPSAALTLAGGVKVQEIFGGDTRLSSAQLEYGRRATLLGRLRCWLDLVQVVRDATRGLQPDEFLVVDPDSRLTQLGLLPLAPDSNYLLFPSREYTPSSSESLARLASDWSGQVFGLGGVQLPALSLR